MLGPADVLILNLAKPVRAAVATDRAPILARIAFADFTAETLSARQWDLRPGAKIVGTPHPQTGVAISATDSLPSVIAHLAKRIVDGDWPGGTTVADYVGDLRCAAQADSADLHVGYHEEIPKACVFTPVQDLTFAKLVERDGDLFVVYNARRRGLMSGYRLDPGQRGRTLLKWHPQQRVPK